MKFDIMFIGPATRDLNKDFTGEESREIGGAVYFCAWSAKATEANICAAVKINSSDKDILNAFSMPKDSIFLLESEKTTLMHNEYFTEDRERRNASCLAQSDAVNFSEIPDVECGLYHLAGLLYGDFPLDLVEKLSTKALVSVDIQSFLRHNENGKMNFHDWEHKKDYLKYFAFLKTDAAEAEILTGEKDLRIAAKIMHEWGAKEILISHNQEMLVYDGAEYYSCPVRARNLSGRTGRGDTTFGAYLSKRMRGVSIKEALLYATALVSLKMERPGPFKGTEADVLSYINEFYKT